MAINGTLVNLVEFGNVQALEGKLLTFIDASVADVVQRKALKDLIRQEVWAWINSMPSEVKEYTITQGNTIH